MTITEIKNGVEQTLIGALRALLVREGPWAVIVALTFALMLWQGYQRELRYENWQRQVVPILWELRNDVQANRMVDIENREHLLWMREHLMNAIER